jgi:hypothetical protein
MSISFEKKHFVAWLQNAQMTDVTYHRSRQMLWSSLQKISKIRGGDRLSVDRHIFNSIKGVLTSRSEDMNDTKRLAFDTALEELAVAVGDVDAADDDDVVVAAAVDVEEAKEEKEEAPKAVAS